MTRVVLMALGQRWQGNNGNIDDDGDAGDEDDGDNDDNSPYLKISP